MTWTEYYEYLALLWEGVNKDSLEEIHEYNELRRDLRKAVEQEWG